MVLKFDVLLGHHTKLTHTKFCDKICHILRVMGKNECARHYKSGFTYIYTFCLHCTVYLGVASLGHLTEHAERYDK